MSERKLCIHEAAKTSLITINKANTLKRIETLIQIVEKLNQPWYVQILKDSKLQLHIYDFSIITDDFLKCKYTFRIKVFSAEVEISWEEKANNSNFKTPPPGFVISAYADLASAFPDFMDWLSEFQIGSGLHNLYVVYNEEEFEQAMIQNIERLPLDPEIIEALPKKFLEKATMDQNGEADCGICLDHMENKVITMLPCKHAFHSQCIESFLGQYGGRSCPLCRGAIVQSE